MMKEIFSLTKGIGGREDTWLGERSFDGQEKRSPGQGDYE